MKSFIVQGFVCVCVCARPRPVFCLFFFLKNGLFLLFCFSQWCSIRCSALLLPLLCGFSPCIWSLAEISVSSMNKGGFCIPTWKLFKLCRFICPEQPLSLLAPLVSGFGPGSEGVRIRSMTLRLYFWHMGFIVGPGDVMNQSETKKIKKEHLLT